jgi:hypothetical protein
MQLQHKNICGRYQEVYIDDHETHTGTMDDNQAIAFAYHLINTADTLLRFTGNNEESDILYDCLDRLEKLAQKEF